MKNSRLETYGKIILDENSGKPAGGDSGSTDSQQLKCRENIEYTRSINPVITLRNEAPNPARMMLRECAR